MSAVLDVEGVLKMRIPRPPDKLRILFDRDAMMAYDYVILSGGRGGGKTETLGQFFVVNSMSDSGDILCLREIQKSMEDSVHKVVCDWIRKLNLDEHFTILKTEIINRQTGARFTFKGMKGGGENSTIKSTKGIKYVWYEEAQTATVENLRLLLPTIRYGEGQRFYFSMNPDTLDDAVPNFVGKMPRCLTIHINFSDNHYCPRVLIQQAQDCKQFFPEEYDHIWLGKPRGDGDRQSVLTYSMLSECIDAHKLLGNCDGHTYGGLDLAAGEMKQNDKNALSLVKGPVVMMSREWRDSDLSCIAQYVNQQMKAHNGTRLFYDAVGVGGFAEKTLLATNPEYGVIPYMGQHSVMGPKVPFIRTRSQIITNVDFFKNLKAQMWWNIRLRAENTLRLKRGFVTTRPDYYLSLDSSIENLDGLIREMAQATWKEDDSGRIVIDKTPSDYNVVIGGKKVTMRSPNRADSINSAFLRSIRSGLKANR